MQRLEFSDARIGELFIFANSRLARGERRGVFYYLKNLVELVVYESGVAEE